MHVAIVRIRASPALAFHRVRIRCAALAAIRQIGFFVCTSLGRSLPIPVSGRRAYAFVDETPSPSPFGTPLWA